MTMNNIKKIIYSEQRDHLLETTDFFSEIKQTTYWPMWFLY